MSASWNFARRPFRDERPVFAAVGVALLLGIVFFAANLNLYWRFSKKVEGTRAEIARLEERGARATRTAEEARKAASQYTLSSLAEESAGLQSIVRARRFSWLALLSRLERTLPPDVRLSRLSPRFDSADSVFVDMAALGRSPDSVVRAIAALSKDPAIHGIELRSESSPEKGVPEGYSFQVVMRYVPEETR